MVYKAIKTYQKTNSNLKDSNQKDNSDTFTDN
jgi:hypothetical protein